ncbi:MAG: TerB family tellurite resistance protein [Alcanivorax sp.]
MPIQIWNKFTEMLSVTDDAKEPRDPLHVATAALMIHVSLTHEDIGDSEKQAVLLSIQNHFDLQESEALQVFEKAYEHHNESTDLYRFTRVIMEEMEYEQQKEIVRLLYRVAFADNHLEHFEEHIVTRIASLLGVGPKDRVAMKQQVRAEISEE